MIWVLREYNDIDPIILSGTVGLSFYRSREREGDLPFREIEQSNLSWGGGGGGGRESRTTCPLERESNPSFSERESDLSRERERVE